MTMRSLLFLSAILLCLLAPTCLTAQTYYKWVDAQGVTHYGDQPPKAKSSRLELRGNLPQAAPAPAPYAPAPMYAPDANEHAYREQACATARRNLDVLASGAMVVTGGTMGSPGSFDQAAKLTPEQRESAKAEAEKHVHELCGQG